MSSVASVTVARSSDDETIAAIRIFRAWRKYLIRMSDLERDNDCLCSFRNHFRKVRSWERMKRQINCLLNPDDSSPWMQSIEWLIKEVAVEYYGNMTNAFHKMEENQDKWIKEVDCLISQSRNMYSQPNDSTKRKREDTEEFDKECSKLKEFLSPSYLFDSLFPLWKLQNKAFLALKEKGDFSIFLYQLVTLLLEMVKPKMKSISMLMNLEDLQPFVKLVVFSCKGGFQSDEERKMCCKLVLECIDQIWCFPLESLLCKDALSCFTDVREIYRKVSSLLKEKMPSTPISSCESFQDQQPLPLQEDVQPPIEIRTMILASHRMNSSFGDLAITQANVAWMTYLSWMSSEIFYSLQRIELNKK